MYARCSAPLMQAHPLILPHRFSFKNSSDDSAFALSSLVSCPGSITAQVSMICNCVNSDTAAFVPCSQNLCSPGLRLYCVIRYPHTAISSSLLVVSSASMACLVSSISPMIEVVACSCSPLLGVVSVSFVIAASTLLCTLTSPSCRNCILGAYVSYG